MAIYSVSILGDYLPDFDHKKLPLLKIHLIYTIGDFVATSKSNGYSRFNFWEENWTNELGLTMASQVGFKCFNYGVKKRENTVHVRKCRRSILDLIAETDLILSVSQTWDFPYSDLIKSCNTYCKIYNYTENEYYE